MKAALAVTILTSTITGSTAQEYNHINKLRGVSAAAEGVSTTTTIDGQNNNQQRRLDNGNPMSEILECTSLTEQTGCNANADCSWCASAAVPIDGCYPSMLTSQLPSQVFKCDGVEKENDVLPAVKEEKDVSSLKATNVQTFNFEGVSLTMSAGEVDGDFCDNSSPISLAGYMNGTCSLCVSLCYDGA